jgi:hypothetical protein
LPARIRPLVPPVIGPWVIRRKMDEETRHTSAGLERTARGFID